MIVILSFDPQKTVNLPVESVNAVCLLLLTKTSALSMECYQRHELRHKQFDPVKKVDLLSTLSKFVSRIPDALI
jgi:hypothetical protein